MSEPETIMRVKEVRVYPIKSIRGVSLPSHKATAVGFEHDRIFMLRRSSDKKNLRVPSFPCMCLFTTELSPPENPTTILVRFKLDHTFDKPEQTLPPEESVLEVPLQPDINTLKPAAKVALYTSETDAWIMPDSYNKWFSARFGFDVELNYIGLHKRQILGNVNPDAPRAYVGDPDPRKAVDGGGGWLDGLKAGVGNILGTVATYTGADPYKGVSDGISFADCAAFLVVNLKSHLNAQARVESEIDIEKFRPNIVVEGAEDAWVEDYWAEIAIGGDRTDDKKGVGETRIAFTSNCARCASINVDYETGRPAEGGPGSLLKSLQSDRRVDPGHKYSPVMGRYGFLSSKNGVRPEKPVVISVGDEVTVTKTNERRTHFYWPSIGT